MQSQKVKNEKEKKEALKVLVLFSSAYFFTKYGHFSELLSALSKSMELYIVSVSGEEVNQLNMRNTKIGLGRLTEYRMICYILMPIIALKISLYCIRNKIDVIIGFNGGYPQLVAHLTSIICHKPFVVYIRVDHRVTNIITNKYAALFWNSIVNFSLRYSTRIISLSKFLNDKAISYGVSENKTSIIPFGVDTVNFKPLPLNEKYPNSVLFIGRWSKEKGTGLLLEIAKRLQNINFILIGVNQTKLGVNEPNLHPIGFVAHNEIPNYMTLGKVVISTSLTEGQPMSCLEALACGKPVIANRAGALPDFITPDVGWIFEKNNVDSAVQILEGALKNDQLLAIKGKNAREYALNYSWEAHREKVSALLDSLVIR
jgi:glycosyltransferase involved in cell wall biosynthesis